MFRPIIEETINNKLDPLVIKEDLNEIIESIEQQLYNIKPAYRNIVRIIKNKIKQLETDNIVEGVILEEENITNSNLISYVNNVLEISLESVILSILKDSNYNYLLSEVNTYTDLLELDHPNVLILKEIDNSVNELLSIYSEANDLECNNKLFYEILDSVVKNSIKNISSSPNSVVEVILTQEDIIYADVVNNLDFFLRPSLTESYNIIKSFVITKYLKEHQNSNFLLCEAIGKNCEFVIENAAYVVNPGGLLHIPNPNRRGAQQPPPAPPAPPAGGGGVPPAPPPAPPAPPAAGGGVPPAPPAGGGPAQPSRFRKALTTIGLGTSIGIVLLLIGKGLEKSGSEIWQWIIDFFSKNKETNTIINMFELLIDNAKSPRDINTAIENAENIEDPIAKIAILKKIIYNLNKRLSSKESFEGLTSIIDQLEQRTGELTSEIEDKMTQLRQLNSEYNIREMLFKKGGIFPVTFTLTAILGLFSGLAAGMLVYVIMVKAFIEKDITYREFSNMLRLRRSINKELKDVITESPNARELQQQLTFIEDSVKRCETLSIRAGDAVKVYECAVSYIFGCFAILIHNSLLMLKADGVNINEINSIDVLLGYTGFATFKTRLAIKGLSTVYGNLIKVDRRFNRHVNIILANSKINIDKSGNFINIIKNMPNALNIQP